MGSPPPTMGAPPPRMGMQPPGGGPPRPGPPGPPQMQQPPMPPQQQAPPAPPVAQLQGLAVDSGSAASSRPRAHIQRRLYAQNEQPDVSDPGGPVGQNGGHEPNYHTPAAAARPAPVSGNNNGSPDGGSAQSRIDPSQIPRPDAAKKAEPFSTRANVGQCPPPATSAYLVEDDGNCSPRYMRLTLNQVATEHNGLTQSGVPFGVVIQPLAEVPAAEGVVPVVDFGEQGPVRCNGCRAYVNPFFSFSDGGRMYTCNLCGLRQETPRDYFCEIDHNGYRRDHYDRAELCRGVVEFVAPAEYQARPPRPPPVVCLLEASWAAIQGGIFSAVCTALSHIIPTLPSYTEVAIIVYDDAVHFFKSGETGLRQWSCPDSSEACVPLPPHELLMPVGEALDQIQELLQKIPELVNSKKTDTALGTAVQACYDLLQPTGGRLLVFQHVLPVQGALKLQQRDDVRLYGTDKERNLFGPAEDSGWKELAKSMGKDKICVSSFHFTTSAFLDVASIASLSRQTGGQLYLYPEATGPMRDVWAVKLEAELGRNLRRPFGYEGIMRVRVSKGLCVEEYLTGLPCPGAQEVDVPGIDADSAFAVTFRHDDKLEDGQQAYVQCALLYTTSAGERRVRVMTIGLQATEAMASLYRYADLDATCNVLMRQAVALTSQKNLHLVREFVVNSIVQMLYTYRKMVASPNTAAGQLVLPESLKLLPLYGLSLTKNGLMRPGTEVRADERAALMAAATRMPVTYSVAFLYPRLFSLYDLSESVGSLDADGSPHLPTPLPLLIENLKPEGAYLIENASSLYVWIGKGVDQTWLSSVLQINGIERIDSAQLRVPLLDNETSVRVNRLINAIRSQRPHILQV